VNLDSKLYFKIYQQLILYEYHIKTRVVKKLYSTTNLLFLYWLFYVYVMANCFMFMWWQIVLCLCDGKLFYVYVMAYCFIFMWWQIVLCLCDGKLFYVYVMAKIRNNLYCVIKSRRKKWGILVHFIWKIWQPSVLSYNIHF
jgi:hypothetical protein